MEAFDRSEHTSEFHLEESRRFIEQARQNPETIKERQQAIKWRYVNFDLRIQVLIDEIQRVKDEWNVK